MILNQVLSDEVDSDRRSTSPEIPSEKEVYEDNYFEPIESSRVQDDD